MNRFWIGLAWRLPVSTSLSSSKPALIVGQDLKLLLESLETNPIQGDALGKDCYKVRMAISSKHKGKNGGARVITCVKILNETIILLSIYDKSEQSDIPSDLIQQLLKDNDLF